MNGFPKKLALWLLILVAAGIALFTSFQNSVEMASIAQTDGNGILRVHVMNRPEIDGKANLLLKLEYVHANKTDSNGRPVPMAFPQPFVAVLADGNNRIVARLAAPDADGNVPAIPNIPRDEKYFWVGFPQIRIEGKPASLLIRNPFFERNLEFP